MIVSIIGARGLTGVECVKRLVEKSRDEVIEIKAIVRKVGSNFPSDDRIRIIEGDFLGDKDLLLERLRGSTHVIFAAAGKGGESSHKVDELGVAIAASASKEAGVKRFVLISSQLVDSIHYYTSFVRMFLNTVMWGKYITDSDYIS